MPTLASLARAAVMLWSVQLGLAARSALFISSPSLAAWSSPMRRSAAAISHASKFFCCADAMRFCNWSIDIISFAQRRRRRKSPIRCSSSKRSIASATSRRNSWSVRAPSSWTRRTTRSRSWREAHVQMLTIARPRWTAMSAAQTALAEACAFMAVASSWASAATLVAVGCAWTSSVSAAKRASARSRFTMRFSPTRSRTVKKPVSPAKLPANFMMLLATLCSKQTSRRVTVGLQAEVRHASSKRWR
mmetsp:Transcript_91260/g.178672  ORF Transcript_91260/g.178672 Transcript_91260/m.178672 type:complete len:247 (-) Transcript_91260:947-1687(-)